MDKSFDVDDFETLYKYEDKSFWFRSRNNLIISLLKRYAKKIDNFLEIGCGTGYVISGVKKHFPEAQYMGSDYYEEGLFFAKKRLPDVKFIQLDAKNIPYKETFDVVGIFDVLEHIDDDALTLKNIIECLTPNGVMIITVPQHKFMWSNADVAACHQRRYTQNELSKKMTKAGFDVKYMSGFVSLLFPTMWLSRKLSKNESGEVELDINPIINSTFSLIMKIEFIMMKLGIKFKFGGSIIAIGVKTK